MALIGTGAALDTGIQKHPQGARLFDDFANRVYGFLLPVFDQFVGEAERLLVLGFSDEGTRGFHRVGRDHRRVNMLEKLRGFEFEASHACPYYRWTGNE